MFKAGHYAVGLVLLAWALAVPPRALGQAAPPPAQAMTAPPMVGNPYSNPALNPYLNPAMTQVPMNANNALLYLYAANAARGGIGSGQLGGARAPKPRSRVAELPNSAATPGGGAARFFNPGHGNAGGAGRYYSQRGRYFNNNGR